ncbi:hypothetical protein K7432_010357 [Basidiobolus ranarum]|uniref:C2H2-type domain-containing protein n=1 Tax=Basidiobolus ranarum TaxID=34480 RepID=A0ABR2WNX1_9FUNG
MFNNDKYANICSKHSNRKKFPKNYMSVRTRSTLDMDFTVFDHVEMSSYSDSTMLTSMTETPIQSNTDHTYRSLFPSNSSLSSTSTPQLMYANTQLMSPFLNTPLHQKNPLSSCTPFAPIYPSQESVSTLSSPQNHSYELSSVQTTPFLTPQVEFQPPGFSSNPVPDQSSFDFSLFCKGGSFHVDDENYEDKQHAFVAPLEEVTSRNHNADTILKPKNLVQKSSLLESSQEEKTTGYSSKNKSTAPQDKKYGCPICGVHFARKFNLNVHVRGHDPKLARPFNCPDCSKSFGRKHDLSRHLATVHNGERPHHCPDCQKHFSRKDGLQRHIAKGCTNG